MLASEFSLFKTLDSLSFYLARICRLQAWSVERPEPYSWSDAPVTLADGFFVQGRWDFEFDDNLSRCLFFLLIQSCLIDFLPVCLSTGSRQAFGVPGQEVPGQPGGVWARAAVLDDGLRRQHVILHHWGADVRALLSRRRDQKDHHGAG